MTNVSIWRTTRSDFVSRLNEIWETDKTTETLRVQHYKNGAYLSLPQPILDETWWEQLGQCFECCADNQTLVDWMSKRNRCENACYQKMIAAMNGNILQALRLHGWTLRDRSSSCVRWIPREQNCAADLLANEAIDSTGFFEVPRDFNLSLNGNLMLFSDAAARRNTHKSFAAWVIQFVTLARMTTVQSGAHLFTYFVDSVEAELTAIQRGINVVMSIIKSSSHL